MKKRERPLQITVIIDDELRQIIDDIRAMTRPVPTVADVVRSCLRKEHDALKRKTAAQERRG